jgi:hypothetical protein
VVQGLGCFLPAGVVLRVGLLLFSVAAPDTQHEAVDFVTFSSPLGPSLARGTGVYCFAMQWAGIAWLEYLFNVFGVGGGSVSLYIGGFKSFWWVGT